MDLVCHSPRSKRRAHTHTQAHIVSCLWVLGIQPTINSKNFNFFIFHFSYFSFCEMFFFLFCYCDFVSVRWCDFSTSAPSIFRRDASSMKFHIARQLRISSWWEIILLSQAVHNEFRFCHTMVRCWNQNEKILIFFFGNFSNQTFFFRFQEELPKDQVLRKCVFWMFIERQKMKWNEKSRIAIVSLDEMNRLISLWIQLKTKPPTTKNEEIKNLKKSQSIKSNRNRKDNNH